MRISLFAYRPRVTCDVAKLSVLPGDVLTMSWPSHMRFDPETAMDMAKRLRLEFPENTVLVLANGIKVESVFGPRVNYADLGVEDPWATQDADGTAGA